MTIIYSKI